MLCLPHICIHARIRGIVRALGGQTGQLFKAKERRVPKLSPHDIVCIEEGARSHEFVPRPTDKAVSGFVLRQNLADTEKRHARSQQITSADATPSTTARARPSNI